MTRSDIHDLTVIYQHATERAVCIRETEDSPAIWIPLSQCEIEARDKGDLRRGCIAILTAQESVLTEKGLI